LKHYRNIVGGRIRALRQGHKWSQAKLAAKCQLIGWDITRDVIASVELRRRWVADAELLLFAKVLQVPLADLYPGKLAVSELLQMMQSE